MTTRLKSTVDDFDVAEKIIDLESRVAFQEDTLSVLSDQVAWQGRQMQLQDRKIAGLMDKIKALEELLEQSAASAESKPPHY